MVENEQRKPLDTSTYEAGYFYAPAPHMGDTPKPGQVPAEEILLTLTGTWAGNLANALDRVLTELDVVTKDEVSFRPETGERYRKEADHLNAGVEQVIKNGYDLRVGASYALVVDQDMPDSDTSRIVFYVLRTA